MEFDNNKQTLTIYGKTERLSVLANRLQALSGKQTYEFLSSRSVFLPRKINVLALRSVLNERLKSLHASELPKEYYAILENYENFSEFQLFNLFATICDNKEDFKAYRLNLWKLILINYEALSLTDGEINYLKNISKLQTEKLEKYFQYITSSAREMKDTFDGLEKDSLKKGLYASASIDDVVDLGAKYGIDLPTEYTMETFKPALREYLAAFNKLTMEIDSYIEKASEMSLENFTIKNNIPLSFRMDKDKLIDYLFFILSIAEMPLTKAKDLVEPSEYRPLQFSVNLDGAFRNEEPLDDIRIIIYDGCEGDGFFEDVEYEEVYEEVVEEEASDAPQYNQAHQGQYYNQAPQGQYYNQALAPQSNEDSQEEYEEAEEYEEEADETEEVAEEEATEEVTNEEPAEQEEEEKSPLSVLDEDKIEDEASNADLLAAAKEGFAAQNRKERKELSFGDVEENPYYGNPKTKKLYTGPTKMIVLTILGLVLISVGAFFVLKFSGII